MLQVPVPSVQIIRAALREYHAATHTAQVEPVLGPASLVGEISVLMSCRPDLLTTGREVAVLTWSDVGGLVLGPYGGVPDDPPNAGDADTVDGIHASATATANKLLALNGDAKLPASITGDADTVDGFHAAAAPAANKLLAMDASAKFPGHTVSGSLTVEGGFSVGTTGAGTGEVKLSGDLIHTVTNFDIKADTANGADTKRVALAGGGATGVARGGNVYVWGNESAGTGAVVLRAGVVTGGEIQLETDNARRVTVAKDGTVTAAQGLNVDKTGAGKGSGYFSDKVFAPYHLVRNYFHAPNSRWYQGGVINSGASTALIVDPDHSIKFGLCWYNGVRSTPALDTTLMTLSPAGALSVVGCVTDGTCEIFNEDALAIIKDIRAHGTGRFDEHEHERFDMPWMFSKYPFLVHREDDRHFDRLGAKSDLLYRATMQLWEHDQEVDVEVLTIRAEIASLQRRLDQMAEGHFHA